MTVDERYPISEPDKSLAELVGELTGELSDMLKTHVELAKVELTDEAKTAARASVMLVVAGVATLLALAVLSVALGWGLAEAMSPGWAFLIVGVVWTLIAGASALLGRQRMQRLNRPLPKTRHEIKEDQRWLTMQNS